MKIGSHDYTHVLSPAVTDLKRSVLGLDANNEIVARIPLLPPSAWANFKAALSKLPLLGRLGGLRQAHAEVESFAVELDAYRSDNRKILSSLQRDLRSEFGPAIADTAVGTLNAEDGAPLLLCKVSAAYIGAKGLQSNCKVHNDMQIASFLEIAPPFPGEQNVTGLYLQRRRKLDWQNAFGSAAAGLLGKCVYARCQALPEYAKGPLTNQQIVAAANDAFALYEMLLEDHELDFEMPVGRSRGASTWRVEAMPE